MTTAMYGSMRVGRCLEDANDFLGCAADVLGRADMMCSGRRECVIGVTNKEMDEQRKCSKDPWRYLEAAYQCKKSKI